MFKTRFISILALLLMAVSGAWATITVTWNNDDITGDDTSFTKDGVTITANYIDFYNKTFLGGGTFTTTLGNFTKIEVTSGYWDASGTGWSGSTWTGNTSSVSFDGDIYETTKIVFTIGPATVAVTGVTLAPTSATLTLGETETVTLIPTVLPAEATDKSVTWTTSNASVATVADGVVTAVAAGEATITVTTTDGAKTATCAVTVAAPAPSTYTVTLKEGTEDATSWTITPAEATTTGVAAGTEVKATYGGVKKVKSVKAIKKTVPVTAITLNKTETSIKVGSTETLSVTAVAPDNATDKTYTWKTSDATKATVDQDGKVTAVAEGTVTIYAEANDGSGVKGNCTVTVTPAAAEGHALSASAVGEIVGTDGKAYAAADKDNLPSGVTAAAMVAYKNATTGKSLAIALADEGEMNWNSAKSTCAGKTAIGGKSWHLPSQAEWKQMFSANGGNEKRYTGLNTAITTAGGTALKEYYWSSTPSEEGYWDMELDNGYANWIDEYSSHEVRVRACFAF